MTPPPKTSSELHEDTIYVFYIYLPRGPGKELFSPPTAPACYPPARHCRHLTLFSQPSSSSSSVEPDVHTCSQPSPLIRLARLLYALHRSLIIDAKSKESRLPVAGTSSQLPEPNPSAPPHDRRAKIMWGHSSVASAPLAAPRRETPLDPETSTRTDPGAPHAGPSGVGGFERAAPSAADPEEKSCIL